MEIIVHRINNSKKLRKIPKNYGVEIDVRDYKEKLILNHDPFKNGENLENFLKAYKHGTLIINVKSEFIENRVIQLLKKYNIKKYFFLDSSYPVIFNFIKKGFKNFAIRISDYESMDNAFKIYPKFKWIWLEIFNELNLSKKEILFLRKKDIKVCFVSPELHNKKNYNKVKSWIKRKKINISAVCVKKEFLNNWIKAL